MEKVDIVRNFLNEIFSIDQRTEHFKRFHEASPEQQKSIMTHLNLHNLFLLRRLRDPGFYQFICAEVFNDKDTLRKLRSYIRKVVDREILPKEEDIFKLSSDDDGEKKPLIEEELDHPIGNPFVSIIENLKNLTMIHANSLKYFQKRYERAVEENDEIAIMAIHSLIVEHRTGIFVGNLLSEPLSPYEGSMYVDRWDFHRQRQMIESLRYSDIWERIENPLFENPAMIIPNELHDYIIEEVLHELTDVIEGDRETQMMLFSKFINNAGSIASVLWFFNKSEREKLDILNRSYEFTPQFHLLGRKFTDIENAGLLSMIISRLMKIGHHEVAITLLSSSIFRTKDAFALYSLYDNLASMKRELGNFGEARENYEKCLANLKRSKPRDRYRESVELKNIGEMCLQLGKEKEAKAYFSRIDHHFRYLDDTEKFGVLWNLANAHRRIGDYEREYSYLNDSLQFTQHLPNDNFQQLMDRIQMIRNAIDSDEGKLNEVFIRDAETNDDFLQCFEYGQRHYASFQIEGSIKWFERANEAIDNYIAHAWIGQCHFLQGDMEMAKHSFQRSIDLGADDIFLVAKLGIIDIVQNNFNAGAEKIVSAHSRCIESKQDKFHFYQVVLRNLLYLVPSNEMERLLNTIADHLPEHHDRAIYYEDIGTELSDLGYLDEGLNYYDKALEHAKDDEKRASTLLNKGSVYANRNDHNEAIEYYKQAVGLDHTLSMAWNNMASSYSFLLNYEKAIDCEKNALKNCPNDLKGAMSYQLAYFEGLADTIINIFTVRDDDIQTVLRTAERVIQIADEEGKIEFSGPIRDYGKSLEMILNRKITIPFSKGIQNDITKCTKQGKKFFIKPALFHGTKSIKPLDKSLVTLIREGEGLSLGAWVFLLKNLNESSTNPIERQFKGLIRDKYSNEEISSLLLAVGSIYGLRNGLSHHSIISREKALTFRKLFIPKLNNSINILYAG